jgi:hypothetical protein
MVTGLIDVPKLFVIYGVGFTLISALFSFLFYLGWRRSNELSLNQFEKTETLTGIVAWAICAVTGFLATLMAAATPPHIGIFSGFIYSTLSITIYFSTRQIMRRSKK